MTRHVEDLGIGENGIGPVARMTYPIDGIVGGSSSGLEAQEARSEPNTETELNRVHLHIPESWSGGNRTSIIRGHLDTYM
jgi:hypothetical protein